MGQLLRRAGDIFAAPMDDTLLLLNTETGQYHGLNPVAARIWELLAEPVSADRLIETLLAEFDVPPDACRQEVSAFLDGLRERGLLIVE